MRPVLAASALALAFAPAAVASETRPGMPAVEGGFRSNLPRVNDRALEADPDAGFHRVVERFQDWNRAQGAPRILLFWNRELSDDTTTRYRDRDRGVAAVAAAPGLAAGAHDRVREQERTTGGAYSDLHPDDSDELEAAFVSTFVDSGADVVDRDAMMRKVSTEEGQDDRADQQFIEARALEQGIDYLVEVLPDYRGESDTGFAFKVKITHLPTARIKSQFRTTALPASGPERLVAAPGGFERRRDSRITIDRIGQSLAADTMRAFF